jgi:hypothetical protein
MELLSGSDLGAVLKARGSLPPAEVAEVFRQLGHALAAAHRAGVVHRDLKPENVFLAEPRTAGVAFTVKVLDFGIAKVLQESLTSGTSTEAIGSPLWMAPEQTEAGTRVGPPADVFALGLLAFRALTGKAFWRAAHVQGATFGAVLREMLIEPIPAASARAQEYGAAVPPGFDAWFARCVARDAAARFSDAGQAVPALLATLEPSRAVQVAPTRMQPVAPAPQPPPEVAIPRTVAMPQYVVQHAVSQVRGAGAAPPTVLGAAPPQRPPEPHPTTPRRSSRWILGAVALALLGGAAVFALRGAGEVTPSAVTSDGGAAIGPIPVVVARFDAGAAAAQPAVGLDVPLAAQPDPRRDPRDPRRTDAGAQGPWVYDVSAYATDLGAPKPPDDVGPTPAPRDAGAPAPQPQDGGPAPAPRDAGPPPPDRCAQFRGCIDCNLRNGCTWCLGTNRCVSADRAGDGCDATRSSLQCPTGTAACQHLTSCDECVRAALCHWCPDQTRCVRATDEGDCPYTVSSAHQCH